MRCVAAFDLREKFDVLGKYAYLLSCQLELDEKKDTNLTSIC